MTSKMYLYPNWTAPVLWYILSMPTDINTVNQVPMIQILFSFLVVSVYLYNDIP